MTNETKDKEIHFRTTETRYKRFSKLAIDVDLLRGQFIEQAIDEYCNRLEGKGEDYDKNSWGINKLS